MNLGLLIHNIGFMTSAVLSLSLGFFVLSRGWNKKEHILYFLTTISFVIFSIAHLLAVNAVSPHLAYFFFGITHIVLLTVCFNAHFGFAVFKKLNTHRFGLSVMYGAAIVLSLLLMIKPRLFMAGTEPFDFMPQFLIPGPYYWLLAVFFLCSALYFFIVLARSYSGLDKIDRNRLNYFFFSFGFAYIAGSLLFLPIFGINISLWPTALIGLYTLPLAYGFLKYDLLDLHVVARHALTYFISVSLVGFATAGVNVFNNYLVDRFPGFPFWPIPFFSGIMILIIGSIIWRQIRQVDILKYEFINNISHKFRTPLTHIRWLAEDLRETGDKEMRGKLVDQIQYASLRLFELTNAIIDVSKDENDLFLYRFVPVNIPTILHDLFTAHDEMISRKQIHIDFDVPENVPTIQADKTRIQFALQIIFENALVYTPDAGKIFFKARQIGGDIVISIRDTGIGIPEEDLSRIFSKFYRSSNARHIDTEGMGIGLYIAKEIIEKHRGKIWATSRGIGKGSEFTVSLPIE